MIRKLLSFFRNIIFFSSSIVVASLPAANKTKIQTAFVKTDNIGDFFIFISALKANKINPSESLLVTNANNFSIAKHLGFKELISINISKYRKDIFYKLKIDFKIRKYKISSLFHPTASREFVTGDLISLIATSKLKISISSDCHNQNFFERFISNYFYTNIFTPRFSNEYKNVESFLNANLSSFNQKDSSELFKNIKKKKIISISPFSSDPRREWSLEKYAELIDKLILNLNHDVVIMGSKDNSKKANLIKSLIINSKRVKIECSNDLIDACKIISSSKFHFGIESAGVHIANYCNVLNFCLMPGGHFKRFYPYENILNPIQVDIYKKMDCFGCGHKCIFNIGNSEIFPCLDRISVKDVFQEIEANLNER